MVLLRFIDDLSKNIGSRHLMIEVDRLSKHERTVDWFCFIDFYPFMHNLNNINKIHNECCKHSSL